MKAYIVIEINEYGFNVVCSTFSETKANYEFHKEYENIVKQLEEDGLVVKTNFFGESIGVYEEQETSQGCYIYGFDKPEDDDPSVTIDLYVVETDII